jgi:hypothetical protein
VRSLHVSHVSCGSCVSANTRHGWYNQDQSKPSLNGDTMDFFKDEDGRLHATRIVGVIYILALFPWLTGDLLTPMGTARTVFTAGWWLTFCDKRPLHVSELLAGVRAVAGVILTVGGLAAQFYLLW